MSEQMISESKLKKIYKEVSDEPAAAKKKPKPKKAAKFDTPEAAVAALKALPLTIEIVGEWVWVSGDTKPHKDKLKEFGLIWARKKKMWFWRHPDSRVFNRRETDMDKIRLKYGVVAVQ